MPDTHTPRVEIEIPQSEVVPPEGDQYIPTIYEVVDHAIFLGDIISEVNNDPNSPINIDMVVPVSRGGSIPTAPVMRRLGIKNNQALAIEFYKKNPNPTGPPEIPSDTPMVHQVPRLGRKNHLGKNVLFFDDLGDELKTAMWVRKHFPLSLFGAIYIKPSEEETLGFIDIYGTHTGRRWIKNPWEVEDDLGYSPVRPVESLEWATVGRPALQELYEQRKALLYRPELLERLQKRPTFRQQLGGLSMGFRHWALNPRY